MINRIFNNQSIFFTITITFLISIILIMVSFTILYEINKKREEHFAHNRNIDVSKMVLQECKHRGVSKELKENLFELKYSVITNLKEQDLIFKNKNLILKHTTRTRRATIQYLKLNDKYLIYINTPRNSIILVEVKVGETRLLDNIWL